MKKFITVGMLGLATAAFSLSATAMAGEEAEDSAAIEQVSAAAEQEEKAEEAEVAKEETEVAEEEAAVEAEAVEEEKAEESEDTKRADECQQALSKCGDAQKPFNAARNKCKRLRQCVRKCKAHRALFKGERKAKRPGKRLMFKKGMPKCRRMALRTRRNCIKRANARRSRCVKSCVKHKRGIIKCVKSCNAKARSARKRCSANYTRKIKRCKRAPVCRTFCKKLYKGASCLKARKLFRQKARKCAGAAQKCKGVVFTGNEKDAE